jgi:hypothetical protein
MSRAYTQGTALPVSSRTHSQTDRHVYEDDVEEQPMQENEQTKKYADLSGKKPRAARGTSPYVQVKVRRDLFEPLAVVAKMNSMSSAQVIEKILEVHVGQFQDTLRTLKLDNMF